MLARVRWLEEDTTFSVWSVMREVDKERHRRRAINRLFQYFLCVTPPQWWHTCQSCSVWVVTCSSPAFMGLFTTCDSFTRKTKSRDKSGLCSITQSWQPSIPDYFTYILWNTLHCNYMTSRCCIALRDLWLNVKKNTKLQTTAFETIQVCSWREYQQSSRLLFPLWQVHIFDPSECEMEKCSQQEFGGDKTGILTVIYANKDAHPCYTLWNQDGRCVGKCTKC